MRACAVALLIFVSMFSATYTRGAEPPALVSYDADEILRDPRRWVYDLQNHKAALAGCFRGDTNAFLALERIAPEGEGESQASALLWLVLHIWGDKKYGEFLNAQPELYRRRVSRTLRWTHDEGDWHHPIANVHLQQYLSRHFPRTWRILVEYPEPGWELKPIPFTPKTGS